MRKRLRAARVALGLTQRAIADGIGVSRNYYCELESGRRTPRLTTAFALEKRLGVPARDLFPDVAFPDDDQAAAAGD